MRGRIQRLDMKATYRVYEVLLALQNSREAVLKAERIATPKIKCFNSDSYQNFYGTLEASPGIEPGCKDLQSSA